MSLPVSFTGKPHNQYLMRREPRLLYGKYLAYTVGFSNVSLEVETYTNGKELTTSCDVKMSLFDICKKVGITFEDSRQTRYFRERFVAGILEIDL